MFPQYQKRSRLKNLAPVNEQPYYSAPEPPPREYSAREPVREPVKEVPPAPRDAN